MSHGPHPPAHRNPHERRTYDQSAADPAAERDSVSPPASQDPPDRAAPEKEPPRPDKPPPAFGRIGIPIGIAILLSAVVAVVLYVRHQHRLRAEAAQRHQQVDLGPRILTTPVLKARALRELTLPADVRAFQQATLYAKVSGYVKAVAVDKGDAVVPGKIIAVLESPEIDQQVASAQADLMIKKRTFERYAQLVKKDFISVADFDTARSQYGVALATLKQSRAMQGYKILRAPFDGTITGRYADPGALVSAGSGGTAGAQPLVDLADLSQLRVTLFVQQDAAPFIATGDPVELTADERPELTIKASITRLARSLDPRTRAMLCEIWLKNEYNLYPGVFMHAKLHLHAPTLPTIPTNAVLVRNGKTLAGKIENDTLKLVPIQTGLDDGKQLQIVSGLQEGQLVGVDIPSELADGARVQPIPLQAQANGDHGSSGRPPPEPQP